MRARSAITARPALLASAATLAGCGMLLLLVAGWAMHFTASAQESCTPTTTGTLAADRVPAALVPLFEQAAARYQLGPNGPAILAGLTKVESDFGRDLSTSSAGAVGWTQFLPGDWRRALFAYNHAGWYVDKVLRTAEQLTGTAGTLNADSTPTDGCMAISKPALTGSVQRVVGGGRIVAIPGQPGELIDGRILPDLLWIIQTFHAHVTDGYAPTGHAADGEHPLGLAVDLVPGPGGSWDYIDRLAQLAEPAQNQPRPPWRWVGYNGDAGHGRGNHLHLSWQHGPGQPGNRPPAAWVLTLAARSSG